MPLSLVMPEKLYKAKVGYFERPISSNHGYNYNIVSVANPFDFMVTIKDPVGIQFEERLKTILHDHENSLMDDQKNSKENVKIDSILFYIGMPVLVTGVRGSTSTALSRGEVLNMHGNELDILLVDMGGVLTKTKDDVLPVAIDLLRIPKLGIPCKLAQVRPSKGSAWPTDRDFKGDFIGSKSQVVTFLDYYPDAKSYETIVEVDEVNISVKYFHLDVAVPVPLNSYVKEIMPSSYPVNDYSAWIGLKVIVFGVKVFRDERDNNKLKCILQMDPETVNTVQEKIVEHLSQTPKTPPSVRKCGSPCLALFGEEYFRATVLKKEGNGNVLVHYVDYGERQIVPASELVEIPPHLLQYPEGATVCQITDFLTSDFQDMDKLIEMTENKDLYAVIDACDTEIFGPELLVSLFEPEDFCGKDHSFSELLKIPDRPDVVKEVLQVMELVPEEWGRLFLTCDIPKPGIFYPGAMISVINNWDSIYIQVSDSIQKSVFISTELNHFYQNGGCPDEVKSEFLKMSAIGKYVAAKQEDDEDNFLYRAKVMAERDGNVEVLYIDYGNSEWVKKEGVFPLHKYFAKDTLSALEVKFIV